MLKSLQNLIPECPLSLEQLTEPVNTPCGHTFNKDAIEEYCNNVGAGNTICPSCRAPFQQKDLKPNFAVKGIIEQVNALKVHNNDDDNNAVEVNHKQPPQATYLKIRQVITNNKVTIQEILTILENCKDLNGLVRYLVEQKFDLLSVIFNLNDIQAAEQIVEFFEKNQISLNPLLMIIDLPILMLVRQSLVQENKPVWFALLKKCLDQISAEAFAANKQVFASLGAIIEFVGNKPEIQTSDVIAVLDLFNKFQYGDLNILSIDQTWLAMCMQLNLSRLELVDYLIAKSNLQTLVQSINQSNCISKLIINHNRKVGMFAQAPGYVTQEILQIILTKLLAMNNKDADIQKAVSTICQVITVNQIQSLEKLLFTALTQHPNLLDLKSDTNICLFHSVCKYGRTESILKAIELISVAGLSAVVYYQSKPSGYDGALPPLIILKNRQDINFAEVFAKIIAKCPTYAMDIAKQIGSCSVHADMRKQNGPAQAVQANNP